MKVPGERPETPAHAATRGAGVIQAFPYSHFANFHRIDGVYYAAYDKNKGTQETFDIFIRPDDGKGKPDLTKPPLDSYKATTSKGPGAGRAPPYYFRFPKPYIIPT